MITETTVLQVKALAKEWTVSKISAILNLHESTIYKIYRGYYNHLITKPEKRLNTKQLSEDYYNTGMVTWDAVSELFDIKKDRTECFPAYKIR